MKNNLKIGFTTFCTQDYIDILNNLVESVLLFSKYEITIFSINFDYVHPSPKVKSKRVDLSHPTYHEICKIKVISSVENNYDVGMVLDCDMIVTKDIDSIFDENMEKVLSSKFPLFAKHPHDPFSNPNHPGIHLIKHITDKKPKMKWVFASYIFSDKNKWFLKEVIETMDTHSLPGEDEIIINALLVKYEVSYDIGYNYLPNALESNLHDYLNNTISHELKTCYLDYECPVKFYTFHGHLCKNANEGKKFINEIKNL